MRNRRLRPAARLAAELLAAAAAVCLLLEAGLRYAPALLPERLQLESLRWRLLDEGLSPDPEMGVAVPAPLERRAAWKGGAVRLRHVPFPDESAIGYRAGAEGPHPERVDVAVLGDSHAYGIEVDEDETWESRLSRLTGLSVANLALPFQGTAQNLVEYRLYGVRMHPRLVLMTVCPNDVWDNATFRVWRAQRDGGDPDFRSYRFREALGYRPSAAYVAQWAGRSLLVRELFLRPRVSWGSAPRDGVVVGQAAEPAGAMEGLLEDTSAIKTLAAAGGGRFAVILTDLWRGGWGGRRSAALKDGLRSRGIPVLDLSERLCTPDSCGPELRLPGGIHWNRKGHERVAEEVRRFLGEHPALLARRGTPR